ncbi:MAG: zinc-ribbon domain-containing protein, partial [Clostridia bacterium]|nr:zinc-ribbon domain-containing protein [Clostridia bacterium]
MKYCPNCGAELSADARFCIDCMAFLGEKVQTKPIRFLGRWQRYLALALLLCTFLGLSAFVIHREIPTPPPGEDGTGNVSLFAETDFSKTSGEGTDSSDTEDTISTPINNSDSETSDLLTEDFSEKPSTDSDTDKTTNSTTDRAPSSDKKPTSSAGSSTDHANNSTTINIAGNKAEEPDTELLTNTIKVSSKTEIPAGYLGIYTKEDLNNIRNNLSGNYILMSDLVFCEEDFMEGGAFYNQGWGWEPIGIDGDAPFSGTLDGNGYVIKNLYINIENDDTDVYAGLFGYCIGSIQNLGMKYADITVNLTSRSDFAYVGGIAGYVSRSGASIRNCYFAGEMHVTSIVLNHIAGGLIGYCSGGEIVDCYNAGTIDSNFHAAGIVGELRQSTVVHCYNSGEIISNSAGGGIVARLSYNSHVSDCHNTGKISGYAGGGIVGEIIGLWSTVSGCYNNGSIASIISGGIIGKVSADNAAVNDCYNTGKINT